jgi:hypothetical protein
VAVVAERAAFWRPLAEDQDRVMNVDMAAGPAYVQVSRDDLAACADILFENVFTHTPEGAALAIRLSHRVGGGSTGLGLDIARRIAEESGGAMTIGRSASGGGSVTLGSGRRPECPVRAGTAGPACSAADRGRPGHDANCPRPLGRLACFHARWA